MHSCAGAVWDGFLWIGQNRELGSGVFKSMQILYLVIGTYICISPPGVPLKERAIRSSWTGRGSSHCDHCRAPTHTPVINILCMCACVYTVCFYVFSSDMIYATAVTENQYLEIVCVCVRVCLCSCTSILKRAFELLMAFAVYKQSV